MKASRPLWRWRTHTSYKLGGEFAPAWRTKKHGRIPVGRPCIRGRRADVSGRRKGEKKTMYVPLKKEHTERDGIPRRQSATEQIFQWM